MRPGRVLSVGSDDIRSLKELNGALSGIDGMISIAINRAAEWARDEAVDRMQANIAFPHHYLVGEDRLRLYESRPSALSAVVTARFRPTQLSRFATNGQVAGRNVTPRVQVTPGRDTAMRSAFFMKLKRGTSLSGNMGIAMREEAYEKLSPGMSEYASYTWNGIKVLYGPSVSQAFESYAADMLKDVGERIVQEFNAELQRRLANV